MKSQDDVAREARGREWSIPLNSANLSQQMKAGTLSQMAWTLRWGWSLLLRNRLAIALASLGWLIYRTGTKPSRLTYPCQQAAVANVGVILVGIIPACLLTRWKRMESGVSRVLAWKRQAVVAGLLFVTAFLGVEGFQYADDMNGDGGVAEPMNLNLGTSVVGIAKMDSAGSWYTNAEIEAMVRKAVARAGGLAPIMVDKNGDNHIDVIIKPNQTQDKWQPGDGVNTHPVVVRTLVLMAQEAGADEVIIADGTASSRDGLFTGRGITLHAFTNTGYDANGDHFDDVTGVQLLDLNDCGAGRTFAPNEMDPQNPPPDCSAVTVPNRELRSTWWAHNTLVTGHPDAVDVLICAPTLKNHSNGGVTLSMKNRVGTAPNDVYHMDSSFGTQYINQLKWSGVHSVVKGFPHDIGSTPINEDECVQRSIVDLNLVRPQDFAVIDGLVGIENGPIAGGTGNPANLDKRSSHLILAGQDSVAIDTVGTIAMGYTPTSIPHIVKAHNKIVLGTMDTSQITVVGDRISLVRDNYQTNWDDPGQQVRGEENPPWLTNISVSEGALVAGGQSVSGSGIGDDVGVVKAEVAVDRLGPNLVANGGFENGSTGWSPWESPWGSSKVRDYANQEPGRIGNNCLKLGNSSSTGSYGAYQQVSVEAGKTYRVDLYWRGQKMTDMNWFEVLLLDGPFSQEQADSGNPASVYVEPNYAFAYDNNTYGLPGPIGTTYGWVWGHQQYSGPNPRNQVDWNNRQGRRTATGTTMTVVLKVGSVNPGIACWFDEVSLREVEGEDVVATMAGVGDPFNITIPSANLKPGLYDAEMRISVFDAMLNEDSIYRNVQINSVPPEPLLCANRQSFTHAIFIGESQANDLLDVWNCGDQADQLDYTLTVSPVSAQQWISPLPDFGSSTSEVNTHTIQYDTAGLDPGLYSATITIEGNATNSPITVAVNLTIESVKVDFDLDGDVDMDDYSFMQNCLSSTPGGAPPVGCDFALLDADADVDVYDLGLFKLCLSGANVIPDSACDDGFN